MTLGRMFLALFLALLGLGFFYAGVSLGWHGPGYEQWRLLFVPAVGLLLGAGLVWPR